MVVKDEWLRAAMTDDRMVVELLVRLKQSQATAPLKSLFPAVLPPRWGLRQPRSRMASAFRSDTSFQMNKETDSTRRSPTTPLSWSGGGSLSATGDGFEESSRLTSIACGVSRSKVTAIRECISGTTTKKLRRKKTFTELKEEESMLLKERVHLKKELATMHATFEEQRARNETLKKMKLDLMNSPKNLCTNSGGRKEISDECHKREDSRFNPIPPSLLAQTTYDDSIRPESRDDGTADSTANCDFFLPDLNMTPDEDDDCGMRS